MSSANIETMTKMLESLPEAKQDQVVEHLREYIEALLNDLKWDDCLKETQRRLIEAARHAKQEIAEGHAKPMDLDQL